MSDDAPRNNAETTPKRQMPEGRKFQPGNPGRPKGSRNKLGEHFIADLYADWQEHGVEVIQTVRNDKPDVYLKVVASILPQKIEVNHTDNMSDDDRRNRIREIAEQLGAVINLGLVAGTAAASGSGEASAGPGQAQAVSTLQ